MRPGYKLLLIGLIASMASAAAAQEVHRRDNGRYATGKIVVGMACRSDARITIASALYLSGEITITTSAADSVYVAYTKVAKAPDRSTAIDFIDLISVDLAGRPESPLVTMRAPNPAPWSGTNNSGQVEAEIVVPPGAEVEINAPPFDVTTTGPLRALDIPESLGRLDVTEVTERLRIATANRRVTIAGISGDISVATTNSTLIARSVTSLEGQARFRNEGGDIRIDGLTGSVNAKNSFGRITIEGFAPRGEGSYIRGTSGPITVEITQMSESQLVITNHQEDIDITVPDTLSAFYTLSVGEDGVIEASNFTFTPDLVQRDRLSLVSGDGAATIRGSVKGQGNIYVRGRSGGQRE